MHRQTQGVAVADPELFIRWGPLQSCFSDSLYNQQNFSNEKGGGVCPLDPPIGGKNLVDYIGIHQSLTGVGSPLESQRPPLYEKC